VIGEHGFELTPVFETDLLDGTSDLDTKAVMLCNIGPVDENEGKNLITKSCGFMVVKTDELFVVFIVNDIFVMRSDNIALINPWMMFKVSDEFDIVGYFELIKAMKLKCVKHDRRSNHFIGLRLCEFVRKHAFTTRRSTFHDMRI
jgi:hypothetical protein